MMVVKSVSVLLFAALCSLSCAYRIGLYDYHGSSMSHYFHFKVPTTTIVPPPEKIAEIKNKEYQVNVPEGFRKTKGNKYFFSINKVTWNEADIACKTAGMDLASISNRDDQNDLITHIYANDILPSGTFDGYWIGGYRLSRYDDWYWTSNQQKIDENSNLWLFGEPNDFEGEDCIELKKDWDHKFGWNNFRCDGLRRFICQNSAIETYKYSTNQMSKKINKQDHVFDKYTGKDTLEYEVSEKDSKNTLEDTEEHSSEVPTFQQPCIVKYIITKGYDYDDLSRSIENTEENHYYESGTTTTTVISSENYDATNDDQSNKNVFRTTTENEKITSTLPYAYYDLSSSSTDTPYVTQKAKDEVDIKAVDIINKTNNDTNVSAKVTEETTSETKDKIEHNITQSLREPESEMQNPIPTVDSLHNKKYSKIYLPEDTSNIPEEANQKISSIVQNNLDVNNNVDNKVKDNITQLPIEPESEYDESELA